MIKKYITNKLIEELEIELAFYKLKARQIKAKINELNGDD